MTTQSKSETISPLRAIKGGDRTAKEVARRTGLTVDEATAELDALVTAGSARTSDRGAKWGYPTFYVPTDA